MANLGAQAGSGFDASDLTTGTLGNTVQDNITRLGTVTTGTFEGSLNTSTTFPAGICVQSFQSDKAQTGQVASDQNAFTCTLGTTAGTSALKHSNSKLVIAIRANLVKRNNDTAHYLNGYLSGGGSLGSGSSGTPIRQYWGQDLPDNHYCGEGIAIAYDTPGSTTPSYYLAIVTSNAANWQFYNIYFTFWEIKA